MCTTKPRRLSANCLATWCISRGHLSSAELKTAIGEAEEDVRETKNEWRTLDETFIIANLCNINLTSSGNTQIGLRASDVPRRAESRRRALLGHRVEHHTERHVALQGRYATFVQLLQGTLQLEQHLDIAIQTRDECKRSRRVVVFGMSSNIT